LKFHEKEIDFWRSQADKAIVSALEGLKPGDGRQILHYGFMLLLGISEVNNTSNKNAIPENILSQVHDGLSLVMEGILARSKYKTD